MSEGGGRPGSGAGGRRGRGAAGPAAPCSLPQRCPSPGLPDRLLLPLRTCQRLQQVGKRRAFSSHACDLLFYFLSLLSLSFKTSFKPKLLLQSTAELCFVPFSKPHAEPTFPKGQTRSTMGLETPGTGNTSGIKGFQGQHCWEFSEESLIMPSAPWLLGD